MENQARTPEQINRTITSARDSVWVINNELEKLGDSLIASNEAKGNIERNVGHLEHIMADEEITGSGQDLSDLTKAIADGTAKLSEITVS
jgi:predicted  nucleic acid-binding Zn-ribbon protein